METGAFWVPPSRIPESPSSAQHNADRDQHEDGGTQAPPSLSNTPERLGLKRSQAELCPCASSAW